MDLNKNTILINKSLIILVFCFTWILSFSSNAACNWSSPQPIPNEKRLTFQECKKEKKIRIQSKEIKSIEVVPNIAFNLINDSWPEGNMIWSKHSPDLKTAVVWIENFKFKRNAWVINIGSAQVEMFTDHAEGRHFIVKFIDNDHFIIRHAGMGYRIDYAFKRISNKWLQTERIVHDVKLW